jgi:aminoglycoside phosphotransferase (APT) family kinase protein
VTSRPSILHFYGDFRGGGVLVHGDFGPNNVLISDHDDSVVLLADWEWSTVGSPLTDLAWAEFIVRMHHPEHVDCVAALFDGYGSRPSWPERQMAMAERAAALETWVRSWKGEDAASTWTRRSLRIAEWGDVA